MSNETTEEALKTDASSIADSGTPEESSQPDAENHVETNTEAPADSEATGASTDMRPKVLIGSQRDPANKELSPPKPKPVREAEKSIQAATSSRTDDPPAVTEPALTENPGLDQPTSTENDLGSPTAIEASHEPATESEELDDDVPQVIFKPVGNDLDKEIDEALGNMSIDELIAQESTKADVELSEDSRHKATVIKVHRDNVFFSLGGRHEGVTSLRQFKKPPKAGSMMDVVVRGFNSEEGLYDVSIPGAAVSVADWSDLTEGSVVEARITGANTGGLECMVHNIRGFIPTSQISTYRVENLSEFINQKLQCVVTEAKPRRKNLVLSHRAILEREQAEKRQELLEKLEAGSVADGTVVNVRDFGAFVDIGGGVEGMVHISKLSWDRVEHPSEVLEVGQKVRVKIEKINAQTGKIALNVRDLLDHPWDSIEQKYSPNSIVKGVVSRIANFGAFVKLEPGIEGMIHISELAHHRVITVSNIVQEGQEIECKILSIDRDAQRMALSLKATQTAPESNKKSAREEAIDETRRDPVVPPRNKPLKGGRDKPTGGEQFGLKW